MRNIFSPIFPIAMRLRAGKNAIWKYPFLSSCCGNLCDGEVEWIEYELWKIKMHFPFEIASDDLSTETRSGSIVAFNACFIELSAIKIVSAILKRLMRIEEEFFIWKTDSIDSRSYVLVLEEPWDSNLLLKFT